MSELLNCPWCGKQPTVLDFLPSCKIFCCDNAGCPAATWNNQTEVLRLKAEIARLREELEELKNVS